MVSEGFSLCNKKEVVVHYRQKLQNKSDILTSSFETSISFVIVKNKTENQLRRTRVQFPVDLNQYGLFIVTNISPKKARVNFFS